MNDMYINPLTNKQLLNAPLNLTSLRAVSARVAYRRTARRLIVLHPKQNISTSIDQIKYCTPPDRMIISSAPTGFKRL